MKELNSEALIFKGMLKPCGTNDCKENCCQCSFVFDALECFREYVEKETQKTATMRHRIERILQQCGTSMSLRGFNYIVEVVLVLLDNPFMKMNAAYEIVAQKVQCTPNCIDRGIRNAIALTRERGNAEMVEKYLGTILKSSSNSLRTLLWQLDKNADLNE